MSTSWSCRQAGDECGAAYEPETASWRCPELISLVLEVSVLPGVPQGGVERGECGL